MHKQNLNLISTPAKPIYQQRTNIAIIFIIICFFILISRLIYLQISQYNKYHKLAKDNRINIIPVPANRGLIYDRHGKVIAKNIATTNLELDPEYIKNIPNTISNLKKFITISPQEELLFYKLLKQKKSFETIPIKLNLSENEIATFAVNKYLFPTIALKANLLRYYPHSKYFAHLLGYVGRISEQDLETLKQKNYLGTNYIGKIGIEQYYEQLLHGITGYQEVELNAHGKIVKILHSQQPTNGQDIYLTIDTNLQQIIYNAIGERRGAAIAINPQNGEILAMVSKPSYDPNLFTQGISIKNFNKLNLDRNQPLLNRAIRGLYPPASIVKPFIILQALQKKIITPEYLFWDKGFYTLTKAHNSHKYRDWRSYGHGWVNYEKAIAESCDTFFYHIGHELEIDEIAKILAAANFGRKNNIDLNGELAGLLPSKQWKKQTKHETWYPGETLITAIGQGFMLATPLQLATAATIIANKGYYFTPHLLKSNTKNKPIKSIKNIDYKYWQLITKAMEKTITSRHGTGHYAKQTLKYPTAAKTGTAQVYTVKQNEKYSHEAITQNLWDHRLFIAFAPINNPKIAVAIIIENAGNSLPRTGDIASTVINYYLDLNKNQNKTQNKIYG